MKNAGDKDYSIYFKKYLHDNHNLTDEEWDLIKDYHEVLFISKNEFFLQQGKVCRWLSFIAEGVMRFCMYRDGEDITCYFVSENDFAGDPDSFYAHRPSERNMQALTDCVLVSISRDNMQKLCKALPRFEEIMGLIDRRVMVGLMTQRDFLQHADAATKYQKFMEYYPHILQRAPLGYVASFLGITQQSLSRLRKDIS